MFLLQPGALGGSLGKSPIMFHIHTDTLSTRKGLLNRMEEWLCLREFGNVALKRAETLLQDQESDKTSLDFLVKPSLAGPHKPQAETAVPRGKAR